MRTRTLGRWAARLALVVALGAGSFGAGVAVGNVPFAASHAAWHKAAEDIGWQGADIGWQ
jgi:hypothetical protein